MEGLTRVLMGLVLSEARPQWRIPPARLVFALLLVCVRLFLSPYQSTTLPLADP